ncbi:ABC transporter permease [Thermomonospora cellulosilytica]|uniref:Transport permease protein n=1 Tax=Thermomonospora cellulosilytica TaxID=1411118 RepID=A0A7W3MYH1_9ACTN|nr:ABC transporter permease [Thermomonospora cellulosilytica]MBA9004220.1 ABC-2 type transport system permease protein [Thermomonospora cellulosilytica]
MSTLSHALTDSTTMLRRQLRHMRRYPSLTLQLIGLPVIFLLLFVYVFGGTLGNGIDGASGGRRAYVEYVTPGIVLMAMAATAQGTAVAVALDMTQGIVARFRTMAIWRPSVLTGHVIASVLQALLGIAAVTGVALLIGFRPDATPTEWLAAAGLLAGFALALTWLTVGFGLAAKTVESASNTPMFLMLLPFLGSGFVPTDTMPTWLRWFAEHQPFTPLTETLRGLLLGTPIGDSAAQAIGWCATLTITGYAWSKYLFNRTASR